MIAHIFNSSIVAGPETLVLPALASLGAPVCAIFLREDRKGSASQGPIDYARAHGVQSHEIRVRGRMDFQAVRELETLLRSLDVTIAHAHDVKASTYTWLATRRPSLHRIRRISTHHGVRGRSGFRAKFYESVYARLVLPKYDQVLTVCTSDRDLLIRRGLSPHRTAVHLNGVDRRKSIPGARLAEAAAIRRAWGIPDPDRANAPVWLGVVGRIAPEKRHDKILKILATLARQEPDLNWRMICFGTGPLEDSLKKLAGQLGIADRIHWMGYRNGVGNELAGLDLLLSLSDAEGLPINLIEAGWAATPVVATRADGNLDLVASPHEGLLIPSNMPTSEIASRLARLIRNHALRRKMGRALQKRVEEKFSGFSWLERLRQIYFQAGSRPGIKIA